MNVQEEDVRGVPVTVEEVQQNTAEQQSTMYSKWHLLVNSNRAAIHNEEEANRIAAILKESIRCTFMEPENTVQVFRVMGVDPVTKQPQKFEKPTIESVNIRMAAEIGEKYKKVHVHANIEVVHHTILQIDVPRMREILRDCIYRMDPNLPFPFMRVKWIPAHQALEKYIGKAPVGLDNVVEGRNFL